MGCKKHRRCMKYRDRLSKRRAKVGKHIEKLINTRLVWKPELPYNLEEELLSYCLMTEREFLGLTSKSIKRMVFDLAIKIGLARPFSVQQGTTGW